MPQDKHKGITIPLVLVFGAVFLILLGGLLGFILSQLKQSQQRWAWNEALHIAEAGSHYYAWCLNNDLIDLCQTTRDYLDPEGQVIGTYSLDVTSTISCGETTERRIRSTGWTSRFPQIQREVGALLARTSVAQYAYLINDNVWAGSDREIRGPYHSNGGIRMDGENYSLVTSAQQEWVCTSSFGCTPCPISQSCRVQGSQCLCPGIFGGGENSDLWQWPEPSFDFEGITVDLASMKTIAQTGPGSVYLPPSTDLNPSAKGYHVKFLNNGVFEVWLVTSLASSWAYSIEEGWHYDSFIITSEDYYNTFPIDPGCSLIFLEDDLWVEGEVKGKVTIASADLLNPTQEANVVLPGNINYTALDGTDGLAVIGEGNVLIGPDSPNKMELRGIFLAQKGHFGRNHYSGNLKEELEITGSIISNGRVGTKWSSGGQVVSGYLKRENYFDTNLVYSPPPFVPYASREFQLVEWEEIE